MPSYYSQGPAQYYAQREGRQDQKFAQMLQMMMQMQAFKERQKQFDVRQESAQRAQDWRETYGQQNMDYQKFLMNPEAQAYIAQRKAEGRAEGTPPKIEKPRVILPDKIVDWMVTKTGYTKEQIDSLPDSTKNKFISIWERVSKPPKPAKAPKVKPQFEKDFNRVKNLLGRYDKEKNRLTTRLPKLENEEEKARMEGHLNNLNQAIYLLNTMSDSTADGNPLSEKDQKVLKGLLNIRRIQSSEDIVLEFKDLPPGTPTASNKSGERVALLKDKWIPILA